MTEMLGRSPSTWNIGTTTELSQNVAAGVTKPAVPGGGRRCHNKSSRRRRSRRRSSGSRKPKSVKGPRAVTSEERTPGSRILHSKTRRVKFDRTGVVSSKLANRKKVVNHLRSNKNIGKTRSRTHGGDRKARPITNHDRRRTRGVWGSDRREDTGIRVVWKDAPESAIHSVLTSGVSPMVLKDCARAAWSHPQARSAAGWAERAGSKTTRQGEQHR